MIENGFDRGGISDEELRELLGDEAPDGRRAGAEASRSVVASPGASPRPASPEPGRRRVLIASRRRDEAGLFRDRLEAHGAAVVTVRNPFTALDQLRRERFDAVITDLDLWADDGALLLERSRPSEGRLHLLFVADPGGDGGRGLSGRLLREGVRSVLLRPVRTADVELAAREILLETEGEPPGRDRASPSSGEPAPPVAARPVGIDAREAAPARDSRAGSGPPRSALRDDAVEEASPEAAEVRWLRLLFHARREMRDVASPEARLGVLARAIVDHLGARIVAFVGDDEGRPVTVLVGRPGERPWDLPTLLVAAGERLSRDGASSLDAGPRPSRTAASGTGISAVGSSPDSCLTLLPARGEDPSRALRIVGIPPCLLPGASGYLDEVRRLLDDCWASAG